MTAYPCCAGLARSPFVLTEHISSKIYIYTYTYVSEISIEHGARSLRSLANYRPSPLAQKPRNGILARGDPITPFNTVKYHPSLNTLIPTEQRGGVRNWRASEASETLLVVVQ